MLKNMTNLEIYSIANDMIQNKVDGLATLPVKVGFYLQKNYKVLIDLARELEEARNKILNTYGTLNEEGTQYQFDDDKIPVANKEIEDLFALEQEVNINMIKLDWLDNVSLTNNQIASISFMIEEEE